LRQPVTCVLCSLLALGAAAPQATLRVTSGAAWLAAADMDNSGDTDAQEWSSALGRLGAAPDGSVSPSRAVAEAVLGEFDLDGDGALTAADLEPLYARSDRDGDGRIDAAELQALDPAGAAAEWLACLVLPVAAAGEQELAPEVWQAFLEARGPQFASDPGASVAQWLDAALDRERGQSADYNSSVRLGEVLSSLDRDRDGRLTLEDLQALFRAADSSGDGRVERSEWSALARAGARPEGAFDVADELRQRAPGMPFERSLADALAVQRATGKPLLLCVNIDGETASEALAFGRYRDPEFLRLAAGFVPLIASPETHQTLEHDDDGARLPCPRFGSVLCSEHVQVEPELFARYFGDRRVAPRHVGVAADGTILFDIFLVQDLTAVDRALERHGVTGSSLPDPQGVAPADLLTRTDALARRELERAFRAAPAPARRDLAARWREGAGHPELLRLALRDGDEAVRAAARAATAAAPAAAPWSLLAAAAAQGSDDERAALAAALLDPAAGADASRTDLARALQGVARGSTSIPRRSFELSIAALPHAPAAEPRAAELSGRLRAVEGLQALAAERPDDAVLGTALAEAWFGVAQATLAGGGNPSFFFEDALHAARGALDRAPQAPRTLAVAARAAWALGRSELAEQYATAALPHWALDGAAPAAGHLLEILLGVRAAQLQPLLGSGNPWPVEWAADLHDGYQVLVRHPRGSEAQGLAALQWFGALGLFGAQHEVLDAGLARWPHSGDLHAWLRFLVLRDQGAAALDSAYDRPSLAAWTAEQEAAARWFRGLAVLQAAEHDQRQRRPAAAAANYRRSCAEFAAAAREPSYADSSAHYLVQAHLGAGQLDLERGDLDGALGQVRAALAALPASGGEALGTATDGLGRTPIGLARGLLRALRQAGSAHSEDLAADLAAAGW
jgi:hypothetical protein